MTSRRRPQQHPRFVGDKAILVNEGVHHPNKPSSEKQDLSGLGASLTGLAVEPQSTSAVVEAFPLPERGTEWDGTKGFLFNRDLSRRNFSGSNAKGVIVNGVSLRGCVLDDMNFFKAKFSGVDARGASCRNVNFSDVTFESAWFNKADFTGAYFGDPAFVFRRNLDVTDSNITEEQIEQLVIEKHSPEVNNRLRLGVIKYRQWTPRQIVEAYDVDAEALGVLLWSSGAQPRHNLTYQKVDLVDFNPEIHHVPQWEVQSLGLIQRGGGQ